jgi:TonB family protein
MLLSDRCISTRPKLVTLVISAALHVSGLLFCVWREQQPSMFRFASIVYAAPPEIHWFNGRVSLPHSASSGPASSAKLAAKEPGEDLNDRPAPAQTDSPLAPTEVPTRFTSPLAFPGGLLDEDAVVAAVRGSVAYGVGGSGERRGVSSLLLGDDPSSFEAPPPPPPEPPAVVAATPPIRIGGNLHPPEILKQTFPTYPQPALRANVEGAVILEAMIGADGRLRDIHVVEGHPLLVQAAIDCVKQWRYRAAVLNGEIISAPATIRVQFTIQRPNKR